MIKFTEKDNSVTFTICVVPRASKSEIVGELGGVLKIRLASPPVDGAANEELIKVLSKFFSVSKSSIEIITGQTSKQKQVRVNGLNTQDFLKSIAV